MPCFYWSLTLNSISLQVEVLFPFSLLFLRQIQVLVVEILFSCDCNPGVLYTRSPCLGVRGRSPRFFFWDVCWPTVLRTHGIGLTLEFSHCISPIKESIVKRLSMVLYCIGREAVRAWRGSASVLLQGVFLHLSGL